MGNDGDDGNGDHDKVMTTAGLLSLFVGSVLASTILPGGVEVLLYAMVESGHYAPTALLTTATIGNTLGGVITYAVGTLLFHGLDRASWGTTIAAAVHAEASIPCAGQTLGDALPAVFVDAGGGRSAVPRRGLFAAGLLAERFDDRRWKIFALCGVVVAVRLALNPPLISRAPLLRPHAL